MIEFVAGFRQETLLNSGLTLKEAILLGYLYHLSQEQEKQPTTDPSIVISTSKIAEDIPAITKSNVGVQVMLRVLRRLGYITAFIPPTGKMYGYIINVEKYLSLTNPEE